LDDAEVVEATDDLEMVDALDGDEIFDNVKIADRGGARMTSFIKRRIHLDYLPSNPF